MGQAKDKVKAKYDAEQSRRRQIAYNSTIPRRVIKAIVFAVLWIPMYTCWAAAQAFRQDKWPWDIESM
jgi:hypothetical protein